MVWGWKICVSFYHRCMIYIVGEQVKSSEIISWILTWTTVCILKKTWLKTVTVHFSGLDHWLQFSVFIDQTHFSVNNIQIQFDSNIFYLHKVANQIKKSSSFINRFHTWLTVGVWQVLTSEWDRKLRRGFKIKKVHRSFSSDINIDVNKFKFSVCPTVLSRITSCYVYCPPVFLHFPTAS